MSKFSQRYNEEFNFYYCYQNEKPMALSEVVDLLNSQYEEIQALKAKLAELEQINKSYASLEGDLIYITKQELAIRDLEQQAAICEKLAKETYTDTATGQIEQIRLYQEARVLRNQAQALKDQSNEPN